MTRRKLLTRDHSSPGAIPAYRRAPQPPSDSPPLLFQRGGYPLSRHHRRTTASPEWVDCSAGLCATSYFQDEVVLAAEPKHKLTCPRTPEMSLILQTPVPTRTQVSCQKTRLNVVRLMRSRRAKVTAVLSHQAKTTQKTHHVRDERRRGVHVSLVNEHTLPAVCHHPTCKALYILETHRSNGLD